MEVGEERTLPPRLEINLAALDGSLNYSDLPKVAELSLGRSQTDRGEADDLPQIEGFVGMAKEQREYSAAGLAKQGGERLRNHIGYNCTQFENKGNSRPTSRISSQEGIHL